MNRSKLDTETGVVRYGILATDHFYTLRVSTHWLIFASEGEGF
jgi:hypothetical protein